MSDSNGTRQLPDVFKELQQARFEQEINQKLNMKKESKRKRKKQESLLQMREYVYRNMGTSQAKAELFDFNIKKASIVTLCICALVLTMVSKNYIFASNDDEPQTEVTSITFETNKNALNLSQIVTENATSVSAKDCVLEQRPVEFETVYIDDTSLQKDEQLVTQEGVNGTEEVKVIKTYNNGEFVTETIIESNVIVEPISKVIHVGNSEFLSSQKVHLGDTLYVMSDTVLRAQASDTSAEVAKINQYYDVKLLEVKGEWCRVVYNEKEGYVKGSVLTSPSNAPTIVEQNRIQKIMNSVAGDMEVNKSSGLTLDDFKKVLSGNSNDVNKIFEDNAEAFYNADRKYNINGIFLAGIAINESGWGTSNIANTKKNLFGYGSYDSDPYNSSYTFEDYSDGIDVVAKVLAKYYVNPSGTEIYDGEVATGKYYNGSTVKAVNIKYATDTEWASKVYSYMEYLYNRL
jgi:flagellum-specific peptidoglycan hydrolase FlgJ